MTEVDPNKKQVPSAKDKLPDSVKGLPIERVLKALDKKERKKLLRAFRDSIIPPRYMQNDTPDGFWIRRLQTYSISGNSAALLLLGSFMNKSDTPIAALQDEAAYFLPFVVGLLASIMAAVFGLSAEGSAAKAERLEQRLDSKEPDIAQVSKDFTTSDGEGFTIELSPVTIIKEFKRAEKYRRRQLTCVAVFIIISGFAFLIGLCWLGMGLPEALQLPTTAKASCG